MQARHFARSGRRIAGAIAVLALVALTISAGIAVADDGDGRGAPRLTTSDGSITIPFDTTGTPTTGAAKRLPLTQVTVSGRCQHSPPGIPFPPSAIARALLETAGGKTMDAFSPGVGMVGGQSLVTPPFASSTSPQSRFGSMTLIVTSNRATATITMGGSVDFDAGTCTFLWQAVESRNS